MTNNLVSIIIPVYNVGQYLDKCIESIVNQTYGNIEIICVNDGSTDDSGERLKRFATADTRIKVIDVPNGGVSRARNIGIESAEGEWIMFVDSDDYLEPCCIETFVDYASESNVDIICADYYVERNSVRKKQNFYTNFIANTNSDALRTIFSTGAVVWDKLYKKDVFKDIRFNPDFKIGEDGIVLCEAFSRFSCAFIEDALYTYMIRENSATTASLDSRAFNGLESAKIINEMLLSVDKNLYDITSYRIQRMILYGVLNKLKNAKREDIDIFKKEISETKALLKSNYNFFNKNKHISLKQHLELFKFLVF